VWVGFLTSQNPIGLESLLWGWLYSFSPLLFHCVFVVMKELVESALSDFDA
jgi:hypothetical protein